MHKRRIITIFILFFIFGSPLLAFAQEGSEGQAPLDDSGQDTFSAEVTKILDEQVIESDDGIPQTKQKLLLKGLDGDYENQNVTYDGTKYNFLSDVPYKEGDKLRMLHSTTAEGEDMFLIDDFIRTNQIYILVLAFIIITIAIGRWKGLSALIGLAISFLIILKMILPLIVEGYNPVLVTIAGAVIIMVGTLYIVHGFNRKTTSAVIGTVIGLVFIGFISWLFTELTRLTGTASEETLFISGVLGKTLNMKGILLAGMIIGALGVLDDITIGQASAVQQIREANPNMSFKEAYKRAMKVGIDHVGAIVNTLFLAYAGAAMPLLLLFQANQPPFTSFEHIINHGVIAQEIVRAVCGSIGLILIVPITTLVAVYMFKSKK
ncbi:YibE/F family protein, partial [Patescibacteria group bacterium]|nr:YibE/F family protein [Patescibacteria group bacterium]